MEYGGILEDGEVPKVLAVVAQPDDESFGLGSVISWLRRRSVSVSVLVFTHGEASTIGTGDSSAELGDIRARELASASEVLGLTTYYLHPYRDGQLGEVPLEERVRRIEEAGPVDALLAFDHTGITANPDHLAATEAALAYSSRMETPMYLWTLPEEVAVALNRRFKTSFHGRQDDEIDLNLDVTPDRECQWDAIRCHRTQSGGLKIVEARLELLNGREHLLEVNLGQAKPSPFR